jgi:molybdopterin-containing oxidoreductase family iron-sulfur binding subunit
VVRPRFAHAVIQLDHGANDRCYNCHLIQDRNKYAANDGSGIMAGNVEQLCARCHGLIYNDWSAGDPDYYYMPVQCQQCKNPPCVKVCPVKATWQEKDGIVVVDYNWCIGCRYCEAACPYHARRFNFAKPRVPGVELNPDMGYLSNRPRYMGVMEKCTFCLHRTRNGRYPACAEVCPTGARKFGDLNGPDSEIRRIVERERVYVLKQDLGTTPRFYYVFAK